MPRRHAVPARSPSANTRRKRALQGERNKRQCARGVQLLKTPACESELTRLSLDFGLTNDGSRVLDERLALLNRLGVLDQEPEDLSVFGRLDLVEELHG